MEQEVEQGITFGNEELNFQIYVQPIFSVLEWNRPTENPYLLVLKSKLNSKFVILENFTDYYFAIDFNEIKNRDFSFSKVKNVFKNDDVKEYFTIYEKVDGINYYSIIFKLGNSVLGLKLETENTIENIFDDMNIKHFEELFKSIQMRNKNIMTSNYESEVNTMNEQSNNLYMESSEVETTINNEYDYSNIVPTAENIGKLVQYCDNLYNQLLNLIEEDENKNIQLRDEYKNYTWKKDYDMGFDVSIRQKNYNNTTCKNYSTYQDALNSNQLNQLSGLVIELNLSFKRGESAKLSNHKNLFKITFKPYEISFLRKSNYNDPNMDQIEETIKSILDRFQVANSIFCTKL